MRADVRGINPESTTLGADRSAPCPCARRSRDRRPEPPTDDGAQETGRDPRAAERPDELGRARGGPTSPEGKAGVSGGRAPSRPPELPGIRRQPSTLKHFRPRLKGVEIIGILRESGQHPATRLRDERKSPSASSRPTPTGSTRVLPELRSADAENGRQLGRDGTRGSHRVRQERPLRSAESHGRLPASHPYSACWHRRRRP